MGPQLIKRGPLEHGGVGCLEHDWRGGIGVEGFLPPGGTQTPLISVVQAGKAVGRHRRRQVVSTLLAEGEKLVGDSCAHDVHTCIIGPCIAAAVAVKTGERIG